MSAGKGGDGCNSLRREKYIPRGGPDGGDGGKGGSVWLEADRNVGDLRTFHFQPQWKARNGETGRGRQQHGKSGADCRLKLPVGTVVYDDRDRAVCELTRHGEEVLFLKGGEGGLGNLHFKSATNQTPREFTEGKPGPSGEFRFVLKTIADVGLVGFPNAGKSTLQSCLTTAHPRIGAYPFTTVDPSVGVTEYSPDYRRLTLADIPGLVKGASENRGLGHRFLRHIERCCTLLIVLDAAGTDGRDPLEDYRVLREELEQYGVELGGKSVIVAANKVDSETGREGAARLARELEVSVYPISAELGEGTDRLLQALFEAVPTDVE